MKAENKLDETVYKTATYLEAPNYMRPEHKEIWDSIVHSMKAGYFKPCDSGLLEEYIKLKVISDDAWSDMIGNDSSGDTLFGKAPQSHAEKQKSIALINKIASTMSTIAQKLGIAPSTRNRADIKDQSQNPRIAESELDSLMD